MEELLPQFAQLEAFFIALKQIKFGAGRRDAAAHHRFGAVAQDRLTIDGFDQAVARHQLVIEIGQRAGRVEGV